MSDSESQEGNGEPMDGVPAPQEAAGTVTENVTTEPDAGPLAGLTSMPAIQPHAIEAAREDEAAAASAGAGGPTDAQGRAFDPALHETGPDGAPRLNAAGGLRMRRGRKPGASAAPRATASTFAAPQGVAPQASAAPIPDTAKIDATATVMAELVFAIGMAAGGSEWKPRDEERDSLKDAFRNYCATRGVSELPPELVVAVALGGYAIPRCFMPETKSKIQRAKEWLYAKIAVWKARRNPAHAALGVP